MVDAFNTAAQSEAFVTVMKNSGNVIMNISGDEAAEFVKKWQQVTAWVLQDTGAAKVSPETLGIERP